MNHPSAANDYAKGKAFSKYFKNKHNGLFLQLKPTRSSLDRKGWFSIRPLTKKLLNTWLGKARDETACGSGALCAQLR